MSKLICITNNNTSKTVEELLKDQGHSGKVEFHCRDGYCGTCKCKIVEGDVKYNVEPLAYLDQNEITPCTARLTGSRDLVIEIS